VNNGNRFLDLFIGTYFGVIPSAILFYVLCNFLENPLQPETKLGQFLSKLVEI
jgi:hypothetical protein